MKKAFIAGIAAIACLVYVVQTPSRAYATPKAYGPAADNTLTKAEKKEGYTLLFNGSTLAGWRTYQNKPGSWSVSDGTFYCQKDSGNKYADLITDDQYGDFELHVDWKIEPNANSGIMYLVSEQYEESFLSGPEYQLLDNDGYKGQIEADQKTAANYGMEAPMVDAAMPVGQWNHTVIIVNKGHVQHWLNDKKVVEYDLWSDKWKAEKAQSKWKNAPGYGMGKTGHIALQDYHGNGRVWFKNIKLKQL